MKQGLCTEKKPANFEMVEGIKGLLKELVGSPSLLIPVTYLVKPLRNTATWNCYEKDIGLNDSRCHFQLKVFYDSKCPFKYYLSSATVNCR